MYDVHLSGEVPDHVMERFLSFVYYSSLQPDFEVLRVFSAYYFCSEGAAFFCSSNSWV